MSDDTNAYKQPKPRFDPTINYGHILTAVSFVIAGAGAYYGMKAYLHNVAPRVAKIEATLQQLANVVVQTGRQDERLNAIERRVDRLEPSPNVRHPRPCDETASSDSRLAKTLNYIACIQHHRGQ
jgi:hypothetical protein